MATVHVSATDDAVAVSVGDVLEWHLTENASTGYEWVISVDSGLQIEDAQPEPPAPAMPGRPVGTSFAYVRCGRASAACVCD